MTRGIHQGRTAPKVLADGNLMPPLALTSGHAASRRTVSFAPPGQFAVTAADFIFSSLTISG